VADLEHVARLKQGIAEWNDWRTLSLRHAFMYEPELTGPNPDMSGACVDLSGADLRGVDLSGANLRIANLRDADLSANVRSADYRRKDPLSVDLHEVIAKLGDTKLVGANLSRAYLSRANLTGTDLTDANLSGATLNGAKLSGADLTHANLSGANLSGANLSDAELFRADLSHSDLSGVILCGANLESAALVNTNLTGADLTGCRIYGVSAWDLKLEGVKQESLVITPEREPEVTVDDMEVAQFLYLLLHNEKLQRVIDTITTKVVLILGRFSVPERKAVLDGLRDQLRKPGRDYVPVVFDFEKPRSQTTINTVILLARMARFVIADISDARSVLQELQAIVPSSPKLPVQPIIVAGQKEPGMFDSFEAYPWFLKVHRYDAPEQLLAHLDERVIGPAEAKAAQLRV
jgi:hypothetical protein